MSNSKTSLKFKIKDWLSLEEAAKHISLFSGEEITVDLVLKLVLDRKLTLSVKLFENKLALTGYTRQYPISEAHLEWQGYLIVDPDFETGKTTVFYLHNENPILIKGIWDIYFVDPNYLGIKNLYNKLSFGSDIQNEFELITDSIPGLLVKYSSSCIAQIQEGWPDDGEYYPSTKLPENCKFVIRTSELNLFEQRLIEPENYDAQSKSKRSSSNQNKSKKLCNYSG